MAVNPAAGDQRTAADHRRHLTIAVLAIAAVAWMAMVAWHGGGHGAGHGWGANGVGPVGARHPGMHGHGAVAGPAAGHAATSVWLAGWAIMIVAMMLPPALPFLQTMARLVARRRDGRRLLLATAAAFVLAWVLAGLALLAAGALLGPLLGGVDAIAARPWAVAGAAALLAGAYQFTPMKRACLAACRSPISMVLTNWRGDAPWRAATGIGLRYGAVCVGCCWALMLLSIVVGTLALPIMVVTALLMAAERMLPWVRPLVALQAGFAGAVGLLLIAGSLAPAPIWP